MPTHVYSPLDEHKEGVGEIRDYYTIDASDQELVKMIDKKIESVSKEYENFRKEGKRNERYWAKDQLEGLNLRWHNSKIVQNRIYMSVETMVPIITSRPAEPVISILDGEDDDEQSKPFVDKLQKVLLDKYNDEDYPQQALYEMLSRHLLLYKIGIGKIIWGEDLDDFIIEFVHPHKIIIGTDGHYNNDVWVAQYLEKSLKDLIKMFPDKEDDILANIFPGTSVNLQEYGSTPIGFYEYWNEDGSNVIWKMRDVILQKKLNPYLVWKEDKTFDKEANHFDFPHKPFMFLNSQNLGRYIWDDTTPISQGISLQDGINLIQRIITDTSRDQGILVGAQELIDRDELYKYTGAPDDKLSVKGGDPTRAIYRVPPKQLASHVLDDLIHLENSADNVIGTHSTTRGEKSKQPTLGQDILSKESDYGRIDAIVRGIERVSSQIYNWEIQMMMVKYKKEHYAKVLGENKGTELEKEIKDYNKRGIKLIVKSGSTLPTDKISQRQEALDLAKMQKISDLDLFKRMDFPNPMEMAKNIYLQKVAPEKLYPDLAVEIQKDREQQSQQLPNGQAVAPIAPMGQSMEGQIPQESLQEQPQQPMQQQFGTQHTGVFLQGGEVAPFEGIDPSQYQAHLTAEFQFLASEQFLQLPEIVQTNYAKHVLAERQMLQQGSSVEGQNVAPQGGVVI